MERYFATAARGTEFLLADELRGLGLDGVREARAGVHFEADLAGAYRACLWSRVASRIFREIGVFDAVDADSLYAGVRGLDWPGLHQPGATLAVEFHGTTPELRDSRFAALKVKDAIVDSLRDARGERPSVDTKDPDLSVSVVLRKGRATVSFDLAGRPLHRRGYRHATGEAPIRETLAAALLYRCGWPEIAAKGGGFLDPMCGSGTLLIEAAMMASDTAPGLLWGTIGPRGWVGHDRRQWHGLLVEAADRREASGPLPPILGRDHDAKVIEIARGNIALAGFESMVQLECGDAAAASPPSTHGLMLTNPPYGERLAHDTMLVPLYAGIGERLRAEFAGWTVGILTPTPELGFHLGLRSHRQGTFFNGTIECKLLEFEIRRSGPMAANAETPTSKAEDFANRLRKNLKTIGRWAERAGVECYRIYDADLPEYALAIDRFGRYLHVQEYAPPKTVDPVKARKRLDAALAVLPTVLEVEPGQVFLKQRKRGKGGARYGKLAEGGRNHEVREGPARFWVNFTDHLDTGLFLDHRPVREYIRNTIGNKTFLNLFCYTATATVHAALGGASASTSVDMSRTYLDWAKRNFLLNGIDPTVHELVQADCLKWLGECGQRYDVVFLDPPTFSSSKRMEGVLDVQRDHVALIEQAMRCVTEGGELLFSTNHRRFKLDTDALAAYAIEDLSVQMLPEDFKRNPRIHRVWRIKGTDRAPAVHPA